jgi:branched-chain amino acid transport system ATP-binding protein
MLEVDQIAVSYYGGVRALHGVSIHIGEGEIVAIVGSNGAGKSTLVRTISGLLKPDRGTITFRGTRIDRMPPHRIVGLGIAHVPEGRRVFSHLTVLENLVAGAYTEKSKERVGEQLDKVYSLFPILREREKQHSGTLSGGEQQMLVIGRALMCRPRLLMLDEPSLGIAPNLALDIISTLVDLRGEGTTILLIEQAVRDALSIADRGYVLQTGRIVATGTGKELLESDMVRTAYLGL